MSRVWWSLALRGVLAILFGIVALFYTGATLLALVLVFGVFAVLSGGASIITAVRVGEDHQRWGWFLVSGIVGIAAGLVSFVWPGITALALVYVIAAWAIVSGIAEIAFAMSWPDLVAHAWLVGISGVISVVFGILLAVWPRAGAISLTWLLGIYAIVYGALMLAYAVRLQMLGRAVQGLDTMRQGFTGQHAHG
jgi:uncharacterized membrane protein HdeD (DUF308 family)